MATRTLRREREFGLSIGAITSAIGGWWLYRGRFEGAARPLLFVGLALLVLGVLFPPALKYPYLLWMRFAEGLSFVMTRVILAIVFFAVVTPIGLLRKALGGDPLRRRVRPSDSYRWPYSAMQRDPRHYERMF